MIILNSKNNFVFVEAFHTNIDVRITLYFCCQFSVFLDIRIAQFSVLHSEFVPSIQFVDISSRYAFILSRCIVV
jgi:hypothetical protein